MAQSDGADTPFGLRGLTGVIDNKGIDDRQILDQNIRPAGVGQSD